MKQSIDDKLAKIQEKRAKVQKELKELKQSEKNLQLEADLKKYKPIAQAALHVFGGRLPNDQAGAENFFKSLLRNNEQNMHQQMH